MTTATLDDLTRAALLAHRAALLSTLHVVVERPDLKAGAAQWLGALEDALELPRTIPRREDRRNERRTG